MDRFGLLWTSPNWSGLSLDWSRSRSMPKMVKRLDWTGLLNTTFPVKSKVWLEGTNLQLPSNITPKLSPRRYRPFKVVSQISKVAYKIKLPPTWKIHDVFHALLLTPYKETNQHRPNFLEPPPDILEGEPEWEVEQILKERLFGRWKKKQYLVHWKGYLPAHDSWVNSKDLHALELLVDFESQPSSIRTLGISDNTPYPHNSVKHCRCRR